MVETFIQVDNLWKSYRAPTAPIEVLKGIDLSVSTGELVAITGVSGAGKSTLLNILGLMDTPDKGRYLFKGMDYLALPLREKARARNETIGFVFQNHHLLPEFDILDNVVLPVWISKRGERKEERERAAILLQSLGMGERLHHKPAELSAGELQRAAIARAFIRRSPLILADEPTGNLDPKTGQNVFESFLKMREESGLTSIIVTHDITLAQKCSRILELRNGKLYES